MTTYDEWKTTELDDRIVESFECECGVPHVWTGWEYVPMQDCVCEEVWASDEQDPEAELGGEA